MSDVVGGVYGNPLLMFPEQTQDLSYFDMKANADSGYGPPTNIVPIEGVIQTDERRVKDSNGNLVTTRRRWLWTEHVLVAGKFVRDERGEVYRVSADTEWRLEAGFTVYSLNKVVAGDGDDTFNPGFSTGAGNFQ